MEQHKMKKIKGWMLDLVTEPDNKTICPVRVMSILGFICALGYQGWALIALKGAFDMVAFGASYAAMIGAMGVALGIKTDSKEVKDVITTN